MNVIMKIILSKLLGVSICVLSCS